MAFPISLTQVGWSWSSDPPDYYFIIYKINPSSPGSRPGIRGLVCVCPVFRDTVSSDFVALLRHLENPLGFGVLGCCLGEGLLLPLVRVVSAVYDCAPSLSSALKENLFNGVRAPHHRRG